MKKGLVSFVLLSTVLMASCQNRRETSSSSISSEASNSISYIKETSVDSSSVEEEIVEEMLWNAEKAKNLSGFIKTWGQTMNQIYKQYSPNNNVDLYGLQLPNAVLKHDIGWQAVIGNTPIVLNWSENGEVDNGYALVAVYSDAENQPYMEKHVYFFTIVAGMPKVLVTSQNQGNGNNYLYFTETENIELREGFSNILGSTIDMKKGQEIFTKDEKISYFASSYEILPYAGILVYEDSGITYRLEEPINNTQSAILEAIKSIGQMSSDIQEQIGEAIPIRFQEPNESGYSITIVDGKAIQANQLFGRIIQGME
ncbi:DUF4767 domain-containing protein [Carnobacterium gallinarum]|uniref:DUF4767 domain-containing protein n=1 Tax=Carnobacterium gallinarum TaxID=2749 RepID=UPI00068CD0F3|nr:DUF4767 domain-containing protein [Carnobacterium gallinarum]